MKKYLSYELGKTYRKYGLFGIILLIISVISIIIGITVTYIFVSKLSTTVSLVNGKEQIDQQLTGIIGDFIGGIVGTIWSFAGVILFFLALRLQSKELSLQLEELKDTREVFKTQQFENTFFNLLKNQNEIRLNTELKQTKYNYKTLEYDYTYLRGYSTFEEIKTYMIQAKQTMDNNISKAESALAEDSNSNQASVEEYLEKFHRQYSFTYDELKSNPLLKSKILFKLTFNKFSNQLSHYFRNIYHILLYVKESEEQELSLNLTNKFTGDKAAILFNNENLEEKKIKRKYKKYSQFLQAQMSSTELLLLFYNALFFPKSKKLVQYYNLVENLNLDDLLYPEIDNDNYLKYYDGSELIPSSILKKRNEIMEVK